MLACGRDCADLSQQLLRAADVLQLQHTRGNQAVGRLRRSPGALDNGGRVRGGWRPGPGTVLLWGRSLCFGVDFYVVGGHNGPLS
jgi:hypothetical protein